MRVGLGVLVILTVGVGGGGVLVSVGMDVFVMVAAGCDVLVCVGKKICVLVGKKKTSPGRRVLVNEIEVRDAVTGGVRDAVDVIVNVGLDVAVSDGRAVSAGNTPEKASTVSACAVFILEIAKSTMPRDCSAAEAEVFVSARPMLAATHSRPIPRPPAATTHRS